MEFNHELTRGQWDALRALRAPASAYTIANRMAVEELVALHLAAINDDAPSITPWGRKVLIRGSSRLWDVAA